MKYIVSTLAVVFLFLSSATAQQITVSKLKKRTHAKQLRMGVLFVQLPNSDRKIKKLREMGQDDLADIEEKEITTIRENIISAFDQHFKLCKFYFIENENVDEVLKGDYQNIKDKNGEAIKNLTKPEYSYIVRYGPGNPNGDHYAYNGIGFQIRYINNQNIETIKYDTFFVGRGRFLSMAKLLKTFNTVIHYQVNELNNKISYVRVKN